MFDIERFIADCRTAVKEPSSQSAVKEIVEHAMAHPDEVERAPACPGS